MCLAVREHQRSRCSNKYFFSLPPFPATKKMQSCAIQDDAIGGSYSFSLAVILRVWLLLLQAQGSCCIPKHHVCRCLMKFAFYLRTAFFPKNFCLHVIGLNWVTPTYKRVWGNQRILVGQIVTLSKIEILLVTKRGDGYWTGNQCAFFTLWL